MKFSQTFACRFNESNKVKDKIFNFHKNSILSKNADVRSWDKERIEDMFETQRILTYSDVENVFLFRKTAIDIANKINIKYEKRFDYLIKMDNGYNMFVVDENRFFKYFKSDSIIACIDIGIRKNGNKPITEEYYLDYSIYSYNLEEKWESTDSQQNTNESKYFFLKLMIFHQFAKHETIYVEPGRKTGTRNNGKFVNDSKDKVTIIDSTWNKIIIRNEGFDVNGHLRLQACGKGLQDRELIWIDSFRKEGYTRGLQEGVVLKDRPVLEGNFVKFKKEKDGVQ